MNRPPTTSSSPESGIARHAAAEIEALRARLQEAEDTLRAIRLGDADALVINSPEGPCVYTLVTADQSYRTLVEQMRDAALILSGEGVVLYCNERLRALLAAPSAPVGRPLVELAAVEDRERLQDLLARGMLGEAEGEIRFERGQGDAVPVRLSISALRTGGFQGLAAVAADLTEQKRREREAERERLTEAVLEFAGTPIVVCDAAGMVVQANRAALHLCGHEVLGRAFEEALPIGIRYEDLREAPADTPMEVALTHDDDAIRFLQVSARRIGNGTPEDGWWVVTLADLTERKSIEDALHRAKDTAEKANRAKSDFLSVMSHELRTPLNSVLGYAELLLLGIQEPLTQQQRVHVERIQASARHQLSLIEELLSFARVEAGREQLQLATVRLSDLVRDVAELLRPGADSKGLSFTVALPPDDELALETDAEKIRRVLINLTANAIKFTRTGSVELSAYREGESRLALRVRDTGPGIPEDKLDTIWQPFTQVDASPTREAGGTGLGLAIVRRLVEFLGGDVEVETVVGQGCTFTVRLPATG